MDNWVSPPHTPSRIYTCAYIGILTDTSVCLDKRTFIHTQSHISAVDVHTFSGFWIWTFLRTLTWESQVNGAEEVIPLRKKKGRVAAATSSFLGGMANSLTSRVRWRESNSPIIYFIRAGVNLFYNQQSAQSWAETSSPMRAWETWWWGASAWCTDSHVEGVLILHPNSNEHSVDQLILSRTTSHI